MKILKSTPDKKAPDALLVTLQLAPGEKLLAIDPKEHYRVPDLGDVLHGESLAGSYLVNWCQISQEWVS